MKDSVFQRIWLPGFVLQSVVIGGGYATGRELVEFFLNSGLVGALLGLLVLAVIGAAAGELTSEHLRLSPTAGTVMLMVLIGILVFLGTPLIEKALAGWSFLLYATYALLVGSYLWLFGDNLVTALTSSPVHADCSSTGSGISATTPPSSRSFFSAYVNVVPLCTVGAWKILYWKDFGSISGGASA